MHLGDLALGHVQGTDATGLRRGDFHHGLVGHHIDHRLILGDGVALADPPLDHLALHDTLTDIRQDKVSRPGGSLVRCLPLRLFGRPVR